VTDLHIPRPEHLNVVETAKAIRATLKARFPGVKFSVRSDKYAGGASIRVRWTDGPTEKEVGAVTSGFSGKRFDGSIDLAYHADSWLLPDGTATVASTWGHSYESENRVFSPPHPAARLVHFGSDYVFCDREYSPEFQAKLDAAADEVLARNGIGGSQAEYGYNTVAVPSLDEGVGYLHLHGSRANISRGLAEAGIVRP
jgi:hypothetical protein